jgi:DNA helicase-2/ATP-dependent DNA helicase PcrA
VKPIDFQGSLNPEQYAAVTAPDGPLLVLAAAGTGKTRTLVYRVAWLVERGVGPDGILLLTFTNRAAREMIERAETLVGPGVGGVWAGTFHHMANRLLRRHAAAAGLSPGYGILDRDDSRSLVGRCVKERNLQAGEFPKPEVLLSLFGSASNTETPLEEILRRKAESFDGCAEDILRVRGDYERRKTEIGALDFDDLLVQGLRLLRERPEVLARYQEQFLHVLVDEYQDTNPVQSAFVDLIAGRRRNLMVVGDDFQSIYSWRGADYRNLMSFRDRYPGAALHRLETNYRSVPEILQVANACIAGNPEQFQKTLRPTREAHRRPVAAKIRDGAEQARYVADLVQSLRRDGYSPSDMAVLYRAHFHSMELQMELTRQKVPYVVTSGVRFFEQAHVKDACSVLRLAEFPGDKMSFIRLLGLLPGMGERTAERAWEQMGGRFDAGDAGSRKRLGEMLRPQAREPWGRIEPVLAAYGAENLREDGGELIHRFVKAFYAGYAKLAFENADRRLEDVQELILYTAKFESAEQFLSEVALLTNLDAEAEEVEGGKAAAIRLSTVHQAKGLEWPAVIVLWVTDDMFPSSRTLAESGDGEAEERRLFYVAVTRAKDELCFCVPEVRRKRDGGVIYCRPSRFLDEIPRGLLAETRPVLV